MNLTPNPYSPRRIKLEDARAGDIFIVADRSFSLKTLLMRHFCRSYYIHAEIYLGGGVVAEARWPRIQTKIFCLPSCGHVVVIRTQTHSCSGLGFSSQRISQLRNFVDSVISEGSRYNLRVLQRCNIFGSHDREREAYFIKVIGAFDRPVKDGKLLPWKSLINRISGKARTYWCSEFVAHAYFKVGIFGKLMDKFQPPDLILPADLAKDVDFGWLVGYMASEGNKIDTNDICLQGTSHSDVCNSQKSKCPDCPF